MARDGIDYSKDYYGILEVSNTVTSEGIKDAYRILAKKYHPDMNNGSKESVEKFKQVSEAFSILSNAEKKSKYDVRWGPTVPRSRVNKAKKSKKQEAAERAAERAKYSPFNYTIDIDVGEVDLWNQTPRKPTFVEERAAEQEKRVQEERRKKEEAEAAERRRKAESARKAEAMWKRKMDYEAWKTYQSYEKPVNKRKRDGWYDVFSGEYID